MKIAFLGACALLLLAPAAPAIAQAPAASAPAKAPAAAPSAKAGDTAATRRFRGPGRVAGIVVPIAFFVFVALIVGVVQVIGYRRDRERHETLRAMVERGVEIPLALLGPRKRRSSDLRRGILCLALGIGLSAALAILAGHKNDAWALGFIPALAGVGYLLVWRLERSRPADDEDLWGMSRPGSGSRATDPATSDAA